MRITLFMAMSLNGMTSRPDYREDFLSADNWTSFLQSARDTGALIWGRKTQEKVERWNRTYFDEMEALAKIVVSTRTNLSLPDGFERAESPGAAVERLANKGLTRATLAGGSILNTAFAKAHLIDEVIVNVEAVIIGKGIPLFEPADFDVQLVLKGSRPVSPRIIQLLYDVAGEQP